MQFLMLALVGCGGGECGVAECADICAKSTPASAPGPASAPTPTPSAPAPSGLTAFEKGLVDPILEDLRAGVRPYDAEGVGICKGGRTCDAFMGLSPGELGPGTHMIKAELLVPKGGEKGTWKVKFDVECTTTKTTANGSSTSTNNYSKEYTVFYAGEDKGYRLMPLYKIDSPNPGGSRDCKYKIEAPHPDGKDAVWSGSWIVPEG